MNIEELVKIVIDVLINFPLIMALVLVVDYRLNGKYDIEFEIKEHEDVISEKDILIRLIKKVSELINKDNIER